MDGSLTMNSIDFYCTTLITFEGTKQILEIQVVNIISLEIYLSVTKYTDIKSFHKNGNIGPHLSNVVQKSS